MISAFKLHDTVMKVSSEAEKLIPRKEMVRNENSLLSELVLCILSSQEKYEAALAVMRLFQKGKVMRVPKSRRDIRRIEEDIKATMDRPVSFIMNGKQVTRRIRFYSRKRENIVKTLENIYLNDLTIRDLVSLTTCAFETRKNIVDTAFGIGPKQASMFLRNVGYYSDYAILDKHVIDYMRIMGMTTTHASSFSDMDAYRKLEIELQAYAQLYNVNLLYLDIAIWTTMRTAKSYC
ncbi:MAG: hypothetical protein L6Q81_12560 [Bacteroidia bacterium]|nr:hypothetical protein [Bacteroidia bacterium]